ncbi:hypothetical protein GGR51DRAFT_537601 [Nemania sp. FL0031]|nr:hypothetical protein GGR51DRAFT_537601 [Nemania sp. FL0031]
MSLQITHPALHIANEIALIHNAMLRGLNAIYLQTSHVRKAQDVADLLFLTQSWSAWLLDHHNLKEGTVLPGFEAVLGVPTGTLTLPLSQGPLAASPNLDEDIIMALKRDHGKDKEIDRRDAEEEEERIAFLLHRVYAYASATHKDPEAYNAETLEGLLVTLADTLVPHLTKQVGLLMSMREMCLGSYAPSATSNGDDIAEPLPIPMVTITRTASNVLSPSGSPTASPPLSPSSSTFSASSASTSASSPANSSPLSLFPASSRSQHNKTSSRDSGNTTKPSSSSSSSSHPGTQNMAVIDTEARDRLARARALLEADDRSTRLTQVYLAADARATAAMDHFVVPPMIVRLRDATATPPLSRTASSSSLSSASSHGSRGKMGGGFAAGMGAGVGMGMGGRNAGEWPRMSIPAVHAIADKLSPRHAGAWRFLPCDVWGRPRELPFAG